MKLTLTKLLIFQDQLYVYGQISTSEGEEFEIATMNSARRFVLWTRINQAAFEDGGGYGEEDGDEDVTDRALLNEMEALVKRGMRDTTTLVNITVTVHFTREFRFVMCCFLGQCGLKVECCFRQSTASPLAFIEQVIAVANEGFENRSVVSIDYSLSQCGIMRDNHSSSYKVM